jgi:hypothetical protein
MCFANMIKQFNSDSKSFIIVIHIANGNRVEANSRFQVIFVEVIKKSFNYNFMLTFLSFVMKKFNLKFRIPNQFIRNSVAKKCGIAVEPRLVKFQITYIGINIVSVGNIIKLSKTAYRIRLIRKKIWKLQEPNKVVVCISVFLWFL